MGPSLAPSTRWLLVAAGLVVVVAVAGLAVGGRTSPETVEEGTPAAAVRDFLTAHQDRDVEQLRELVARDLRDACDEDELRRGTRDQFDRDTDFRAVLVDTEEFNGTAEVEVRRTEHHGEPPFGGGGYERTEIFELTREGGDWRISLVPWSYRACPEWSR